MFKAWLILLYSMEYRQITCTFFKCNLLQLPLLFFFFLPPELNPRGRYYYEQHVTFSNQWLDDACSPSVTDTAGQVCPSQLQQALVADTPLPGVTSAGCRSHSTNHRTKRFSTDFSFHRYFSPFILFFNRMVSM